MIPTTLMSHEGYGKANLDERRAQVERARKKAEAAAEQAERGDHHLRSGETVMHYHLSASDGDIGHVQDFLVDDDSWAIRYMIVNTSNWWLGHQVLIPPQWITGFNWADRLAAVALTRDAVRKSPSYKTR